MTKKEIIRAWKDEAYRNSLSQAERAMLPENPAGIVELTGAELEAAAGGRYEDLPFTASCSWTEPCIYA